MINFPNGNITNEGTTRNYFWTAGDILAAYSNQAGSSNPTVYTWYFYNAAGERVKKLVKKGQQLEVTFYMDGGLFETSYVKPTGGSIDNNRFYNTLHVLDGSSRISTIRVGTDADDSTPAIKYFLEDHLMDNLVVLKTDGTLINREEFYPFGETSFGGYGKKRYRYNGKEKDEESGLYNYGQRYYAPWLCRFVSVDPVAEKFADLSAYNYAGNMPVSKVDIDGLQQEGREGTPKSKSVTDGAGNSVNIDPGAKLVEGDTAIISQQGDKFVNVNGVGLVKEGHLKNQNIVPKASKNQEGTTGSNEDTGNWFDGLFDWVPDLEGSGDKSGIAKSGLTHISEDATEINNSGIEGKEVEGEIEVDVLQYILRRAPGPLKFDGYNNLIDALSSGTDLIKEITDEGEPNYDYPLPKKEEKKDDATQSHISNEAKTASGPALENFSKDSLLYGKGKNEYGSHTYGYYHPDKDSLVLNQNGTGFIKIQKNNH